MPSIAPVGTEQTLRRIHALLSRLDALPLLGSLRPRVEAILIGQAGKIMDSALPWQRGHGRRTADLARRIGSFAQLSPESLHHLTLAALVHDIGLLALPRTLVSHIGCLDDQAYAVRQSHPRLGAEFLQPFPFLRKASIIIAHHHERWDGSGYPYGIRGVFIPIEARVLAVADAFDAVQIRGVFDQEARDRAAYRILTVGAGTQFDPEIVQLCGHCLQRRNLVFSFN